MASRRLDAALLDLAAGRRRTILELVRDHPDNVIEMAEQFRMPVHEVWHDLSMFHMTEYEERHDAVAARHDPRLQQAAAIEAESRVLDIGCGSGVSTRDAARRAVSGTVLGVDSSGPLIKMARERSRMARLSNTTFEHADAQVYPFEEAAFDVAISRFGAAYFEDPGSAFANIARALRPGGRLALISWRELAANEWMSSIRAALALEWLLPEPPAEGPGPFGLSDEPTVRRLLAHAGFADISLVESSEPVSFGPDTESAFAFVSTLGVTRELLEGVVGGDRRRALEQLRSTLAEHETTHGVLFRSSAWIITARRT